MFRFVLFLFITAHSCAVVHADGGPQRFTASLPENWQEATRLRLVIEGIRTPGDTPLKLRVTATADEGGETLLGSVGVEAIGPTRSESRYIRSLRMDVTRSLRRYLQNKADASTVELQIQAVDARNKPIRNLKWSVDKVRIETQKADHHATNRIVEASVCLTLLPSANGAKCKILAHRPR